MHSPGALRREMAGVCPRESSAVATSFETRAIARSSGGRNAAVSKDDGPAAHPSRLATLAPQDDGDS
jgi:hypothetical protein